MPPRASLGVVWAVGKGNCRTCVPIPGRCRAKPGCAHTGIYTALSTAVPSGARLGDTRAGQERGCPKVLLYLVPCTSPASWDNSCLQQWS